MSPTAPYTATAGFRSTGLVGEFTNIRVGMSANGSVRGGAFQPARYREDVRAGRESAALTMTYRKGVPTVRGDKLGLEAEARAVAPRDQKGSLDPLSATFALLRDQPREGMCQIDRFMYDGARRTRVVMTTLSQDGADLLCSGQFLRIGGYTERELRRSGTVDVSVRYRATPDGWAAVEAQFRSLRGTLRMTRR